MAFPKKILAALLLLQVAYVFGHSIALTLDASGSAEVPVVGPTDVSNESSAADAIAAAAAGEVEFDVAAASDEEDSNESDSETPEELMVTQVLLPLLDVQRVQNFLFMVSMYFAKKLTYFLMKYAMKLTLLVLTMTFNPQEMLHALF